LRHHNHNDNLATKRLAFSSAISAVLSFIVGLGDRHHENFMLTTAGRLLHVDYGYALGREPLDSVLIHLVTQGARPIATLQYEELSEALGAELLTRIFWPVVHGAFLRVRQNAGLVLEMIYTAQVRLALQAGRRNDPASLRSTWNQAQIFVAQRCVPVLREPCAERFIHALLWQCTRHESATQWRDKLKEQRTSLGGAAEKAYEGLIVGSRRAQSAMVGARPALLGASTLAKGAARGLFNGVCELFAETAAVEDQRNAHKSDM
jgi:hypothetical protein